MGEAAATKKPPNLVAPHTTFTDGGDRGCVQLCSTAAELSPPASPVGAPRGAVWPAMAALCEATGETPCNWDNHVIWRLSDGSDAGWALCRGR